VSPGGRSGPTTLSARTLALPSLSHINPNGRSPGDIVAKFKLLRAVPVGNVTYTPGMEDQLDKVLTDDMRQALEDRGNVFAEDPDNPPDADTIAQRRERHQKRQAEARGRGAQVAAARSQGLVMLGMLRSGMAAAAGVDQMGSATMPASAPAPAPVVGTPVVTTNADGSMNATTSPPLETLGRQPDGSNPASTDASGGADPNGAAAKSGEQDPAAVAQSSAGTGSDATAAAAAGATAPATTAPAAPAAPAAPSQDAGKPKGRASARKTAGA
jgi:hypothetical protein